MNEYADAGAGLLFRRDDVRGGVANHQDLNAAHLFAHLPVEAIPLVGVWSAGTQHCLPHHLSVDYHDSMQTFEFGKPLLEVERPGHSALTLTSRHGFVGPKSTQGRAITSMRSRGRRQH